MHMLAKNAENTVLLFDESFYQFIQKVETHRTLAYEKQHQAFRKCKLFYLANQRIYIQMFTITERGADKIMIAIHNNPSLPC